MKRVMAALVMSALFSTAGLAADNLPPYAAALKERADKGDAASAYNLAVCYHLGEKCPQDDVEAGKWLEKAADKGDVQAIINLGEFNHEGLGMKKDDEKALSWYRIAAGHGSAEAEYNIGTFYASGFGVKQDDAMAIKWMTRAANQGLADAQIDLARLYMRGTTPDYEDAYFWFAVAARKGDDKAATFRDRIGKTLTAEQVDTQQKKVADWRAVAEPESFDASRGLDP